MERKDIYENLRFPKSIPLLETNDLFKLQKPIGRAIYKHTIENSVDNSIEDNIIPKNIMKTGRPKKKKEDKARYNDKVKCDICGIIFSRSNRCSHNNTTLHKAYRDMNRKLYKLLLLDNKNE